MNTFVHANAICESSHIGNGTRIWAFAHVLPAAKIGEDCNICDGVFIENDVLVGDRVTVKCGVQLWDGIVIENDVFVGPNATFTNDKFPRSKKYLAKFRKTIVRQGASIGAGAIILPGIEIGEGAMVGAGAVVTRAVPPYAVVMGNPARITGYVSKTILPSTSFLSDPDEFFKSDADCFETGVGGATLHKLKYVQDMRGDLAVGNFQSDVPFNPKRFFLIFNVPTREVRGEHAHRYCHQFLICLRGSCHILLDDGVMRKEYILNRPDLGVYMPPRVWGAQFNYTPDAVLLVFASELYDVEDYIRNYAEFSSISSSDLKF